MFHVNFQGCIVQLKTAMFQPRDQLDWTKAKTQTEHMEGNTVIWKAILWILVIHCQDTRKQAVVGTQARDSYPSHIIENADCHFYPWSSCMWSYQQVELPEKKRWSAGLEGNFFTGRSGRSLTTSIGYAATFLHWIISLESFAQLLLLAACVARNGIVDEEYVILADFFSRYPPWN